MVCRRKWQLSWLAATVQGAPCSLTLTRGPLAPGTPSGLTVEAVVRLYCQHCLRADAAYVSLRCSVDALCCKCLCL